MSTIIPDTIMGFTEGKNTGSSTPIDVGAVVFKQKDYPQVHKICGFAAGSKISPGIGKITFHDFLDDYNLLGELQFTSENADIKEVELNIPTINGNGWSSIAIRHYITEGGLLFSLLGGVRIC
jgi:hypothetical protein